MNRPGYAELVKNGIVVPPADPHDCHPRELPLDVSLQPNS
jgi:hypothetical protein